MGANRSLIDALIEEQDKEKPYRQPFGPITAKVVARYNAFESGGAVEQLVGLLQTKDLKNLAKIDTLRIELESLIGEVK